MSAFGFWERDGTTEHPWLERPGDDDERLWLFKEVVVKEGHRQGEDWVEKVSSVVAGALGIPRADVDLAERRGMAGCIVRDAKPHQWQFFSGADLLTGLLGPTFDRLDRDALGHRLDNVAKVLKVYGAAPHVPHLSEFSAFDCFSGYLALDAMIANRDRHPRNWAVLQAPPGQQGDGLCPSYDHASGLGFGMTDAKRERCLEAGRVEVWAALGTAKSFEHGAKPWPSLVDVAVAALQASSVLARVSSLLRC